MPRSKVPIVRVVVDGQSLQKSRLIKFVRAKRILLKAFLDKRRP